MLTKTNKKVDNPFKKSLGRHASNAQQDGVANAPTIEQAVSAFDGFSSHVIPGSFYPPWVWQALERELTSSRSTSTLVMELHISTHLTQYRWPSASAMPEQAPRRDPDQLYCTIGHVDTDATSVEGLKLTSPFGGIKRVMCVPQTYTKKTLPAPKYAAGKPRKRTILVPDVKQVVHWLNDYRATHRMVLGFCSLGSRLEPITQNYWVIASKQDAMQWLKENNRTHWPCPSQNYLGEIRTASMQALIYHALNQHYFVAPKDWPKSDEKELNVHFSSLFTRNANAPLPDERQALPKEIKTGQNF